MQYLASLPHPNHPSRAARALLGLTLGVAAVACSGSIGGGVDAPGGPAGTETVPPAGTSGPSQGLAPVVPLPEGATLEEQARAFFPGAAPAPAPARLWLLTHAQYDNTVAALLPVSTRPSSFLQPELLADGYRNQAAFGSLDRLAVEQRARAAAAVAEEAVAAPERILPCRPADPGNAGCVESFVRDLLPRAYRRPVTGEEVANLLSLYRKASAAFDPRTGLRLVLTAILRSPNFLYRVESGPAGPDGAIRLDGHALAALLSYTLWDAPPDEELGRMAEEGRLSDPAVARAQAERLAADPRAEPALARFVAQWLGYDELPRARKDAAAFPFFDAAFAEALFAGAERFVGDLLRKHQGLTDLLLSPETVSHLAVARHVYGVDLTAGEGGLVRHAPEPGRRAGLLLQPAFLAAHAGEGETKVTERGLTVLRAVTCQAAPPPPAGVDTSLSPAAGSAPTTRARFEAHATNPACAGCHALFDPMGLALEQYDAVGRHRTHEPNGARIDPSGTLLLPEGERAFADAPELMRHLAASPQVHQCFVRQAFRYFAGRREQTGDDPALRETYQRFVGAGLGVRELLVALTVRPGYELRGGTP